MIGLMSRLASARAELNSFFCCASSAASYSLARRSSVETSAPLSTAARSRSISVVVGVDELRGTIWLPSPIVCSCFGRLFALLIACAPDCEETFFVALDDDVVAKDLADVHRYELLGGIG